MQEDENDYDLSPPGSRRASPAPPTAAKDLHGIHANLAQHADRAKEDALKVRAQAVAFKEAVVDAGSRHLQELRAAVPTTKSEVFSVPAESRAPAASLHTSRV